jgi:hypothetical protein
MANVTDDARAKALKLCRTWYRRAMEWDLENTDRYVAYSECMEELADSFGITIGEIGQKGKDRV